MEVEATAAALEQPQEIGQEIREFEELGKTWLRIPKQRKDDTWTLRGPIVSA